MFGNFVYRIYFIELEIKNTTYTLVCFIPCPTPRNWQWGPDKNKLWDKRYDFNFLIVNFPFICSNIPAAPSYGVYNYVLHRWLMLTGRRLSQGLLVFKFIWFTCYATYPCHKGQRICSVCRTHNQFLSSLPFLTKITRQLPLLGQELFSILKHLISPHNGYGYISFYYIVLISCKIKDRC